MHLSPRPDHLLDRPSHFSVSMNRCRRPIASSAFTGSRVATRRAPRRCHGGQRRVRSLPPPHARCLGGRERNQRLSRASSRSRGARKHSRRHRRSAAHASRARPTRHVLVRRTCGAPRASARRAAVELLKEHAAAPGATNDDAAADAAAAVCALPACVLTCTDRARRARELPALPAAAAQAGDRPRPAAAHAARWGAAAVRLGEERRGARRAASSRLRARIYI